MATNWREIGDVPLDTFRAELERVDSPMAPHAEAIWNATRPHSALALAMSWVEQKHGTYPSVIPADYLNPWSQTRPGASSTDGVNRWMRFPSYADAAAYWKDRVTSPTGPYKDTVTVDDLINIYAPPSENDTRYYATLIKGMVDVWPKLTATGTTTPMPPSTITYGRVPHPPFTDRPITKPAGFGQDNLGRRLPKFVVLHRMLGSLWGTDGHFRLESTAALTDYDPPMERPARLSIGLGVRAGQRRLRRRPGHRRDVRSQRRQPRRREHRDQRHQLRDGVR
jgi:hypothetical protein